ncbi:cation-translocating P-type ATPase [Candidatus Amarolinea aalborgensis]|uniref:cation-translocating P-type ATPase n=1 Tax=Candidatus Amarolinea aalborgensis TaxID=2249329 RepID=UPI003BFA2B23
MPPQPISWHSQPLESVISHLQTRLDSGLTSQEAAARLQRQGHNELRERPRPPFWKLVYEQLSSFVVVLLIVASVVSALLGDWVEAGLIMTIVVLNAVLGVTQESRAEQALNALKKMAAPEAEVLRDGHRQKVPARELVQGDVVLLEAGNYVPADLRLVETINLKIDEASLTGESVAVQKQASVTLASDIPLGDRHNAAYMSSLVTYGRGKGLVVSTGMGTQIGLIADMIQSFEEEPTPLQRRLEELGKTLSSAALLICLGVFVVSVIRDTDLRLIFSANGGVLAYLQAFEAKLVEVFLIAVSLAIAAVPEGLPAIVTISLALGMREMIRRHALIRKLSAVETLGSATVICSDKTGTLTQNEMTAVHLWVHHAELTIEGGGYQPEGLFRRPDRDNRQMDVRDDVEVAGLLWAAALANDADLEESGSMDGKASYRMVGDPTEGALIVAAAKADLWRRNLEKSYPRVAEAPFDAERKRMSTIHRLDSITEDDGSPFQPGVQGYVVCVKGAPDLLLAQSSSLLHRKGALPMEAHDQVEIHAANARMASQALRVLGVAYRYLEELPASITAETVEHDLVFIGLIGMIDPPRPEVAPAVAKARAAGLRTVMITGDYSQTARAIAQQIGLLRPQGQIHTGAEIDAMSDAQLVGVIEQTDVFARVSPQHKVRIVEAFKACDEVVAMTGDGVNDAPALKRANIGIAMGITGTDVSKETADIVLTDDNYVSIVGAVEQGRIIYSNIRKFVFYLLSCNVAEVAIIFIAALAGWPPPLTAIQLLWLNLLTDGAPALALGMEKGDPDVMQQPPRPPREPIINRIMLIRIAIMTVALTAVVLTAFWVGLREHGQDLAETMAFATLALAELPIAYTSRSERYPLLRLGFFTNKWMQMAVGVSILLTIAVIFVPFLNGPFNTVPLTAAQWELVIPLALVPALVAEISKFVLRWADQRRRAAPA